MRKSCGTWVRLGSRLGGAVHNTVRSHHGQSVQCQQVCPGVNSAGDLGLLLIFEGIGDAFAQEKSVYLSKRLLQDPHN